MNHSIDTDCKEAWEEFLGCPLTYKEYSDIDAHLDYMILDYDTKEEFYKDFVWLCAPISISEKFSKKSRYDRKEGTFQFLVPKTWLKEEFFSESETEFAWLIEEFFGESESEFESFMFDYTSEETSEIYPKALLHNKVLFEKII